jgi:hypothetical protein
VPACCARVRCLPIEQSRKLEANKRLMARHRHLGHACSCRHASKDVRRFRQPTGFDERLLTIQTKKPLMTCSAQLVGGASETPYLAARSVQEETRYRCHEAPLLRFRCHTRHKLSQLFDRSVLVYVVATSHPCRCRPASPLPAPASASITCP